MWIFSAVWRPKDIIWVLGLQKYEEPNTSLVLLGPYMFISSF